MEEQYDACLKNSIRLQVLMSQACVTLRRIFRERWENFAGEAWVNSPTSGQHFITTLGSEVYKKADPLQRRNLETGDVNHWDLLTLSQILVEVNFSKGESTKESKNISCEKRYIRELVDTQYDLLQYPVKAIGSQETLIFWKKVARILVHFGCDESKLEELRLTDNIADVDFGTTQFLNPINAKEADRLKDEGNEKFKMGNLDKALQFYTEALALSDISHQAYSVLYSNRAAVYIKKAVYTKLTENEKNSALENAQNAVNFHPNWWKAHYRLWNVYEILGQIGEAFSAFECASALNPEDEFKSRRNFRKSLSLLPRRSKEEKSANGNVRECTNEEIEALRVREHKLQEDILNAHNLRNGLDGEQSYEKAAKLYEKAASQGNAEGMFNLAMLTKEGLGVKKDAKRSVELLKQAAAGPITKDGLPNRGVSGAIYELGLLRLDRKGLDFNIEAAAIIFHIACEYGHGCAANMLGNLYVDGLGITRDVKRGVQYWKLAASRNVTLAVDSLYNYFLNEGNPEQAKKWFRVALAKGSALTKENRKIFEEKLRSIQDNPVMLEILNWEKENGFDAGELSLQDRLLRSVNEKNPAYKYFMSEYLNGKMNVNNFVLPSGVRVKRFYLDEFKEAAEKRSKTAQKMHQAETDFSKGVVLLQLGGNECKAIHHVAECYRTEYIVAKWEYPIRDRFLDLVEKRLRESPKNDNSSLDCDLRVCYAHLTANNLRETITFLDRAIAKYPDELCFYDLRANLFGFLREYDEGLKKTKEALKLFKNDVDLLHAKAEYLSNIENMDPEEIIRAYEKFLSLAEIDHRKVPDAHYNISMQYMLLVGKYTGKNSPGKKEKYKLMMKHYNLGLEAEKSALPYFLPYVSYVKDRLGTLMELHGFYKAERLEADSIRTHTTDEPARTGPLPTEELAWLSDPHRLQVIKEHRQLFSTMDERKFVCKTPEKPNRKPRTQTPDLTGLKAITLRDMDPKKNHVYRDSIVKLVSVEEPILGLAFIQLLVQDENNYIHCCHVYNFAEQEVQKKLGFGCKFSLVNPETRLLKDGKATIRVDDPTSQLRQSDRDMKRCRFCGKSDSPLKCCRCRKAFYCTKECQIKDWKLLKHELICTNVA